MEGPPLCKSCAAIEMVRRGPRRPSVSTRREASSGSGNFALGFLLGFFCCPSLLGLFVPGWGASTKKGIVVGFLVGIAAGYGIQYYRASHGLPPIYER
ncbi:MAG: hypothetical protein GWN25_37950 [Actinobacteria bacterium]|nr:hypothetical protein [Actinomycetota bacterium]